MVNQNMRKRETEDDINIELVLRLFWKGKLIIASVTLLFSLATVWFAISLPDIYESESLLAPVSEGSAGNLNALAGQLGGLASLAGMNLSSSNDKTTLALEILKSRAFIADFIERHNLLVPLMASNGWDRAKNDLLLDSELYYEGAWVRVAAPPYESKPSLQEAYKRFRESLSVSQSNETGYVKLKLKHYSPFLAKQWLELLVTDINSEIKNRDVAEARDSIKYLADQVDDTALADMKKIFYELIEEHSKTIMFAQVRDEYVFKTIDPPVVSEKKREPRRALICLLGFLVGFIVSVFLVLVRFWVGSCFSPAVKLN